MAFQKLNFHSKTKLAFTLLVEFLFSKINFKVKLWSKSGNLRSTLAQTSGPIYSVGWSPENDAVLFASGKTLTIKPLSTNSKSNAVSIKFRYRLQF